MYGGACELCRNFIATAHGGLRRRPGTRFVGLTKYADRDVAFVPFVFSSTGDSYAIEFGDEYIRFWSDGGQLVGTERAITGITNSATPVVSYTGTDPANGDEILINGVLGMPQVNNRRFTVANVNAGANTFELAGTNTTTYGTYISGGTFASPIEVVSPYTDDEVDDLQFVQVGNVVYLAHPNHKPQTLTRNSHSSWTIDDLDFVDGPYFPINDTDNNVVSDAALESGTNTELTFDSTSGINGDTGFVSTDIGRHIRVKATGDPGLWVFGIITAVTSTTVIEVDWIRGITSISEDIPLGSGSTELEENGGGTLVSPGTKSWRLGSFSDTTGYPACVETFESRLVWARTPTEPRTLYFSRTGLPGDYCPSNGDSTVTADMGFALTLLDGLADSILWLKDAPRLQVGTSSGVRTLGGSDTRQAIAPNNVSQRREVTYGSSSMRPAQIGSSALYATRFGTAIRNLTYSFEQNGLIAPNISIISEHLFEANIAEIAITEVPEPIAWVRKTDGALVGITYDNEQRIASFHRHDFGDDSLVKRVCAIPGDTRDELWLVIERTTADGVVRSVEYLEADFPLNGSIEDAYYVDFGATYDGAPTNTISGLWHLRGMEVSVLADGAVLSGLTVSSTGVLTFANSRTYSTVHIGLPITSEIRTLRPPYQQNDGWLLGRRQTIAKIIVDVWLSGPLRVGTDHSTMPISYRLGNEEFGTPPALRSGSYHVPCEDRWRGGQAYATMTVPLPCYLRSLLISLDVEEAG